MRRMEYAITVFLMLLSLDVISNQSQPSQYSQPSQQAINYFNSALPQAHKPTMFAKGRISNPVTWEEKIAFSPDGKQLFFGRHPSGGADYQQPKILSSRLIDGKWSEIFEPDFTAGKQVGWPVLSPDGKKLFMQEVSGQIYYSENIDDKWSELKEINPKIDSKNGFGLAQIANDNTFYFYDIYQRLAYSSTWHKNKIKNIQPLPYRLNPASEFFVSRNNDYMIFCPISWHTKLHISFKHQGQWTLPQPLTDYFGKESGWNGDGGGPYISPDEKYFFYTRWGDIYWTTTDFIDVLRDKAINRKE